MKCGFCGYEFDASEGGVNCPGCPLAGNCGYIRCPRCGYDSPQQAALITLIRGLIDRWSKDKPVSLNAER